jgi:5-methylcytosine-specific restriction protein B
MIDNYFNDAANTLLERFPGEADRAWAETVIQAIRRRHESADHYTAGGASKGFIDIRIGKKDPDMQKGKPVFYIRQPFRNGHVSLLVSGLALKSGVNEVLEIEQAPTDARIDEWLDALEFSANGRERLKGAGRSPIDYREIDPGDADEDAAIVNGRAAVPEQALNRILYGPPGTGKTYRTVREALSIVEGTPVPTGAYAEQKARFDALRREGRIAFVTFHQSFSYEDFIEGIRAETMNGQLHYQVRDGIFKRLAVSAMYQKTTSTAPEGEPNFDDLHDAFMETVKASLPYSVTSSTGSQLTITGVNDRGTFSVTHPGRTLPHGVSRARLKALYDAYSSQAELEKHGVVKSISGVIGKSNPTVYWAVLSRLLAFKEEVKDELDDGQSAVLPDDVPDYDQLKRRVLAGDTLTPNGKPYVLIIDEINRGNMSRIFGELITLIEPSKRAGRAETAEVILPYSNERFSVPDNLYVIGTMNTADRSLAVVDTALRRRFDFIEMMPDLGLLDSLTVDGISIARMLEAINLRIEHLYDREHTIGHSFFLPLRPGSQIAELARIFRNNVLPLLEEYFYEDWDKINKVLGNSGIYKSQQSDKLGFVHKAVTWRRIDDKLMSPKTYLSIYTSINTSQDTMPVDNDD